MPISSFTDARNAVMDKFTTAWNAQSDPPEIIYEDSKRDNADTKPDGDTPWVRIQMRHLTGDQRTLGQVGARRFERRGLITVSIYTPAGLGLTTADTLSKVALDAFEGQETAPDTVLFRNVRMNEVGVVDAHFLVNVLAEFDYQEVK